MVLIAILNLCLLARSYQRYPSTTSYCTLMKDLAVPFIWQTSYRSVFPEQYTTRIVFW